MSWTDLDAWLDTLAVKGVFICPHCDYPHNIRDCGLSYCKCCVAISNREGFNE